MSDAEAPATCPDGHADTVRLLSMLATTGTAPSLRTPSAVGGGCCGGACGCAN